MLDIINMISGCGSLEEMYKGMYTIMLNEIEEEEKLKKDLIRKWKESAKLPRKKKKALRKILNFRWEILTLKSSYYY